MKSAILFVCFTKNNIFLSLTTLKGEVLKTTSLGKIKRKTHKKLNSSFSQFVVVEFIAKLKQVAYVPIHLKLRGFNKSRRGIVKVFKRSLLQIATIHDVTANPHNGCKASKKRRL